MNSRTSPVFAALGRQRLAAFKAIRVPGKILWFNFELARELGLAIPSSNRMTPELRNRLTQMFSLRTLRKEDGPGPRRTVWLYADRYGGDDIVPCLGAGRSGFLRHGNVCLKGVGHTPLFRPCDADDFEHSHGGNSIRESMFEAVFGEVNHNLLTHGSARILVIVDQGDHTVYPDGLKERRAISVRAGLQLRPAHLFARGIPGLSKLGLFVRMTRFTGQLETRRRRAGLAPVPDLERTMRHIVDDHALTAAELFRWRMLHGALSLSNMELGGGMLDTTTQSAQPRTAPLRVLTYHADVNIVYGKEHLQRAEELRIMYKALVRSIPASRRAAVNASPMDFTMEMNAAYDRHLRRVMIRAAGVSAIAAARLCEAHPRIADRFRQVIVEMAGLRNRGSINANKPLVRHISVVDVFNLLRRYPSTYFAGPHDDHRSSIRAYLRPIFKGNRFQRARLRAVVAALSAEFAAAYADVMTASSAAASAKTVIARAEFENRPLHRLYRGRILTEFKQAVGRYESAGESAIIRRLIADCIAASVRNRGAVSRRAQLVVGDAAS